MGHPFADNNNAWSAPLSDVSQLRKPRRAGRGSLSIDKLVRALRRQWPLFLVVALCAFGIGAAYAYFAQAGDEAMLVWGAFGVGVGLAAAISREVSRDTVGGPTSVKRTSGYAILGATPELTRNELRALPPDLRTPSGCVTYYPASNFAASFRDLEASITDAQIIAFLGSIPNEGATTSALAFALSAAQQGRRVIILDCDVRRRSLTRQLMPVEPEVGMWEVAAKPDIWQGVVEHESETGLHFIPVAPLRNPWRHAFSQQGLKAALAQLRQHYDLIVLDCPPALSNSDSPYIARNADKRVIVARWDETPLGALRATMRVFRLQAPVSTGVLMNRVPAHYRFDRQRDGG